MKKIYTLLAVAIFTFSAIQISAQSPRITFVEEATQASCPPCATLNPPLLAMVDANPDKVIFLSYQVWWPGFDPMYLDNESDVDDRIGYYGINAAPNIVSGDSGPQSTSYLTQGLIDNNYAETAAFDVNVSAEMVDGILQIDGNVVASGSAAGDIKLRLILAEKNIAYDDAPGGTNGETEYHHVMKKFIGGTNGISLTGFLNAGDSYTIDESLDMGTINVYNFDQLEVIAIVQSDDTKFVYQAAKDSDVNIILSFTDNGVANEVFLPELVCSGSQTVTPSVKIQNGGNADLTSIDIIYSINGGADQTYNWTGSLSSLANETVTLDPYTFTAVATNTVIVNLANPNGNTDEDLSDNETSGTLGLAPDGNNWLSLTIQLDNWPEETSWEILDGTGSVYAGGGPYAGQTDALIEQDFNAPIDCYTLRMMDAFGDGMYAAQWGNFTNGSFLMMDNLGTILASGGGTEEWSERDELFAVSSVTGLDDIDVLSSMNVYPNPATNNITIDFDLDSDSQVSFEVFNLLGERVYVSAQANFVGTNQVNIDVTSLTAGMYTLNMIVDGAYTTTKVTITK